ncbi:hypothetical protein WICPIJ_001689 [Wickerhamomyces pijperi]|uniref:Homeobox domain-containing protein n=1 Tax=Wickerhamomyces pijperi TaxID=599730 RepID=A0A9P8QCU5_WICPI|nr:hypothetical protein WICPIJ_001689 [Wickerhamomyces pijperi]
MNTLNTNIGGHPLHHQHLQYQYPQHQHHFQHGIMNQYQHGFPQSIPTPPILHTPTSSAPATHKLLIPESHPSAIRIGSSSPVSQISAPQTPIQHVPVALPSIRELLNPSNSPQAEPPTPRPATSISLRTSLSTPQPQSEPLPLLRPSPIRSNSLQQTPVTTAPLPHELNRSNSFQQHQHLQPLTISTLEQQRQIEQRTQPVKTTNFHPYSAGSRELQGSALSSSRKKRQNLPRKTTLVLLNWLSEHLDIPYPSSREKYELLKETNLTIQQLDNWFINARRRKISVLRKLKENDQNIALSL